MYKFIGVALTLMFVVLFHHDKTYNFIKPIDTRVIATSKKRYAVLDIETIVNPVDGCQIPFIITVC